MGKLYQGGDGAYQPTPLEMKQRMDEMARILKMSKSVECDKCKNKNFLMVYRIKRISGLLNGTGKDSYAPIQVYACADCGNLIKEMLKEYVDFNLDDEPTEPESSLIK